MPRVYVRWLDTVIKIYSKILLDTELQIKLTRLRVTTEDLNTTRTEYLKRRENQRILL
ncbi:MAG: hypothetical protein PF485_08825 [Bacteroidales bacterium]|jgi:hypothetical protein|nr:hypothetical protein [Bacteroidales bacterium]